MTEATSTLDGSLPGPAAELLLLLDFGSPNFRYLPGVGRRLVRTHKQRAVAMVVPNGLSVDPEQPDQHFAVSFSKELAACLEEFK